MKNRMRAPEKCLDRNAERFFLLQISFFGFSNQIEREWVFIASSWGVTVDCGASSTNKKEKLMINRHTNYLIYRRHVSSSIFHDIWTFDPFHSIRLNSSVQSCDKRKHDSNGSFYSFYIHFTIPLVQSEGINEIRRLLSLAITANNQWLTNKRIECEMPNDRWE